MFQETETWRKKFIFSLKKAFLIFQEMETTKKFLIFQETELSYISGKPKKLSETKKQKKVLIFEKVTCKA